MAAKKRPNPQAAINPETRRQWSPRVDFSRDEQAFRVSIALPGVDPKNVRAEIRDSLLTVQGHRSVPNPDIPPREVERIVNGRKRVFLEPIRDIDDFVCQIPLPATLDVQRVESLFQRGSIYKPPDQDENSKLKITIAESANPSYGQGFSPIREYIRETGGILPYAGDPFPIDIHALKPANIATPESENDVDRQMRGQAEKSFVQDGIRWFPLSSAAPIVQAPASTILDWIKKETKFDGQPLKSYHFAPANRYFVSEESIHRMAYRFVRWPSQKPAGPVILGETKDKSGYIGLTNAAHTIGVDHHTIWRWTTKGTAPTDKPLDVIKDPASDQYYIGEKDVAALKKLVPRSGLRRGRRPQASPQHG
jgi:HSP20 family molecular chaperone IbpA